MNLPRIAWLARKTELFGLLGASMAVVMFLALIEVALSNWRGDTTLWIQPLATLVNCCCWAAYGLGIRDVFVLSPNIVGIVVSVLALVALF